MVAQEGARAYGARRMNSSDIQAVLLRFARHIGDTGNDEVEDIGGGVLVLRTSRLGGALFGEANGRQITVRWWSGVGRPMALDLYPDQEPSLQGARVEPMPAAIVEWWNRMRAATRA